MRMRRQMKQNEFTMKWVNEPTQKGEQWPYTTHFVIAVGSHSPSSVNSALYKEEDASWEWEQQWLLIHIGRPFIAELGF